MSEDRLGRIEGKLDKLAEAVVSLARMEEREITLFKRMDTTDLLIKDLQVRMTETERGTIRRSVWERAFDKGFWVIFGAGVITIIKHQWGV